MKKIRTIGLSAAAASVMMACSLGAASAATNQSNSNGNVGSSGIPRATLQQDRQQAAATVLNTTTDNVKSARQNHTLKQLIQQAGLDKKTFDQKVKAELTSELESQGYSQDQITIALQHKEIAKLHHKAKRAHQAHQS